MEIRRNSIVAINQLKGIIDVVTNVNKEEFVSSGIVSVINWANVSLLVDRRVKGDS